jgi:hypothetical protein
LDRISSSAVILSIDCAICGRGSRSKACVPIANFSVKHNQVLPVESLNCAFYTGYICLRDTIMALNSVPLAIGKRLSTLP